MHKKPNKYSKWEIVSTIAAIIGITILGIIAVDSIIGAVASREPKVPEFKDSRFETVEYAGKLEGSKFYIIRDTKTDVKYILCTKGGNFAISPLIEPEESMEAVNTVIAEPSVETKEVKPALPIDQYKDAARYLAKTVYGEARGCSTTEQAAVIWCILNRVDYSGGNTSKDIIRVVTAHSQFHGYDSGHPVTDEHYNLAIDVLTRWLREKNGETNIGRVLPRNYLYFSGDGKHNYFRDRWDGGNRWDWRLKSPYEGV